MQATVTLKIADLLDYLPKSPSDVTIDRLKRFAEQLESGEPIPCTLVSQEQTPDGPITIVKDGTLGPDGIKPNDPDRADGV
jgi:hypothetical protein